MNPRTTNFDAPIEIDDVTLAFPANALDFMPVWENIPERHKRERGWTHQLWSDLFFRGLDAIELYPKEGIEPEKAFRQLRAIAGSFAPQHEHKEATLSYLTEKWFEGATWTPSGGEQKTSLAPEELEYLISERAKETEH